MAVKYKKIVKGIGAPLNTNLLWLDTSNPTEVSLKYFLNGEWSPVMTPNE